jgi:Flp pilus assembly protein TadD
MPSDSAAVHERAIQLLKRGAFAEAISFLDEAIEKDPEDVNLYEYLGYAYAKSGKMYEAIDVIEHAIDLDPKSPKLHYNLGIAYEKVHNFTQAKEEFTKALGLDPGYTPAKTALDLVIARIDEERKSGTISA